MLQRTLTEPWRNEIDLPGSGRLTHVSATGKGKKARRLFSPSRRRRRLLLLLLLVDCFALRLSRAREKQAGPGGASAAACGQEAQGRAEAEAREEGSRQGQPERAVSFLPRLAACGSLGALGCTRAAAAAAAAGRRRVARARAVALSSKRRRRKGNFSGVVARGRRAGACAARPQAGPP